MPSILCVCEPLFRRTSLHWHKAPPPKKCRRKLSAVASTAAAEETAGAAAVPEGVPSASVEEMEESANQTALETVELGS